MQKSMNFSESKTTRHIVSGVSWVLIAGGGVAFLIGGRALYEFAGINRAIAELEGLAGAAVLIALGAGLRLAAGLPLMAKNRQRSE